MASFYEILSYSDANTHPAIVSLVQLKKKNRCNQMFASKKLTIGLFSLNS